MKNIILVTSLLMGFAMQAQDKTKNNIDTKHQDITSQLITYHKGQKNSIENPLEEKYLNQLIVANKKNPHKTIEATHLKQKKLDQLKTYLRTDSQ